MLPRLVCINDYEQHARSVLQKSVYDYYKSGANDEETLADNIRAFSRTDRQHAYLCRATAMQCMAHVDGELATVRAHDGNHVKEKTAEPNQLGVVAHACNLSTQEFREERSVAVSKTEQHHHMAQETKPEKETSDDTAQRSRKSQEGGRWRAWAGSRYLYTFAVFSYTVLLGYRTGVEVYFSLGLAKDTTCQTVGTGMMLSSWATSSIEEVAEAGPEALRWMQLYIYKDREVSRQLVKRAEQMGYKAIFVTVDTPYLGNRFDDVRNRFKLPPQLRMKNFETNDLAFSPKGNFGDNSGLAEYVAQAIDPSLCWDDIKWLRRLTSLPIVVKGILRGDDAREAIKLGVDGILVSNHGARQLDGVPATIDALPEIVEAVEGKVEVFLDGGVRKGTDVLKALALGAKAVFVGRPVIWGLAFQGEKGVQDVLELLKEEFRLAMALSGCQNVKIIDKTLVRKNPLAVSKI